MVAVAPRCEARVSAELLRILAGLDLSKMDEPPPPPETEEVTAQPAEEVERNAIVPGQTWLLRRDGSRPLRLEGALLCDVSRDFVLTDEGHCIRANVRLFLAMDGTVYAQAICIPDDGLPALPIHRASPINTAVELSSLMLAISPRACLAVAPPGSHLPLAQSNGDEPAFAGIRQSDLSPK